MAWITAYQRWLSESESLQNAQLVADHFGGTGWTPEAISALCGNMRHESSINPDMYEYGYDWGADRGYGLVQWTPRSKYWDWATAQGLEPRDGNSQLARIDYEQEAGIQWISTSSYPLSFHEFTQSTESVSYLTQAFTWNYERPLQSAGEASMPDRIAFAEKCLNTLDFSGSGGGGGSKPFFPARDPSAISSEYGWRTNPVTGEWAFHDGMDIGGQGQEWAIYATQTGTVIANSFNSISGHYIRIQHTADPYISGYQHLAVPSPIPVGATVTKGQEIGTMGTTGSSTGIHLHFQIATRPDGFFTEDGTIDPRLYLDMMFGDVGGGGGDGSDGQQEKIFHLLLSGALNGW